MLATFSTADAWSSFCIGLITLCPFHAAFGSAMAMLSHLVWLICERACSKCIFISAIVAIVVCLTNQLTNHLPPLCSDDLALTLHFLAGVTLNRWFAAQWTTLDPSPAQPMCSMARPLLCMMKPTWSATTTRLFGGFPHLG